MCLAVPGQVVGVSGDDPLLRSAKVRFGGIFKDVSLAFVPDAREGDYLLVHVGFALTKLDEQEAARVFETLRELEGE